MTKITRPAIEVKQGRYNLYLTSFTAEHFNMADFYDVKKLNIDAEGGYQRGLQETRVKRFVTDIIEASHDSRAATEDNDFGSCFYPTSVFLTTEHDVEYDDEKREILFDTSICPFNIVDGQHRVAALRKASNGNTVLDDFPMPVTLATNLKEVEQMLQFLIVNSQQKKVEKGVEQHIYARLCDMKTLKPMPFLPGWVEREVGKGLYRECFDIVKFLNNEKTSPWRGKIVMADDDPKKKGVKQAAFVGSLKRYIFAQSNLLHEKKDDIRYVKNFLLNYWIALTEFTSRDIRIESDSNIFKTNGLNFFHEISSLFAEKCLNNDDATVPTIRGYFEGVNDWALERNKEVAKLMASANWAKGGEFGKLNLGGIRGKASEYSAIFKSWDLGF